MRTTTIVLGALGAFATLARADDGGDDAPTRELGHGHRHRDPPTSLPTQIPTTIEGITGDQVAETINATDSEDALKYFRACWYASATSATTTTPCSRRAPPAPATAHAHWCMPTAS